ncbi:hypothetical protein R6Q57_019862 [Mikania cordata]
MSSSSTSSSVRKKQTRIFKVGVDGNVYCKHDMVAITRVAGSRSTRQGHEFYGCPLWPRLDCKFFMWKEEVDAMFSDGCNHKLLESKNKALEMKIANLKVKKTMLEEDNKSLKQRLSKSSFFPKKCLCLVMLNAITLIYCYFKG